MGQIYSILRYTTTTKNSNLDTALSDNFSCKICLEILHDPVQCQNNEHYFCRKCITKHLHDNTETCPLCDDQLTLEMLRPPSRIVLDVVSQLGKQRIDEEKTVTKPKGQIFIFGGRDDASGKSVEVFNWSTNTWTLFKNFLFFRRYRSFSFLYEKKIMVCGGWHTERIEYLNPNENEYSATVHSVSLPIRGITKGVLHEKRILTFLSNMGETSLEPPGVSRTLITKYDRSIDNVQLIGNSVYIIAIGEKTSSMEKYDFTDNKWTTLPCLPYKVSNLSTVAYKDNIIIIGGYVGTGSPLNDVVMFNVTKQEYKRLPSMLEKRACCAAVIMGDVIVVMGGEGISVDGKFVILNTAEYYVIGHSKWQNLQSMNLRRSVATACVYG